MIGSVDLESVKECVPILKKYLGDTEWWLPKLFELAKEDKEVAADLLSAQTDTMPALISCLRRPEPYTRKKAVVALGQIAKEGRAYVELAISILEEISEKDPDDKVKLEVRRILESISPHAAVNPTAGTYKLEHRSRRPLGLLRDPLHWCPRCPKGSV